MLNIKIIATGDIKEAYLRDAIKEYQKRLSAWCTLEEIILKEERISDNPSEAEIKKALEIEEKRILERLSPKSLLQEYLEYLLDKDVLLTHNHLSI